MVKRICILICFIQSFVAQYINAQTNISVLKEYVATPNLLINKLCLNEMIAEKYLKMNCYCRRYSTRYYPNGNH